MDAFIGEIRLLPYTFAPDGWFLCDGSIYNISQYQALYAVIGNTYGGTPNVSFAVPDLRGFVPTAPGGDGVNTVQVALGKSQGDVQITLSTNQIPAHNHVMNGLAPSAPASRVGTPANTVRPCSVVTTSGTAQKAFSTTTTPPTTFAPQAIGLNTPADAAHTNQQPYLTLTFMIAWQGEFPIRS